MPTSPSGLLREGRPIFLVGFLLTTMAAPARTSSDVWFARAGAAGDGRNEAAPIGDSAALDGATRPGDVIILLPGNGPFDGGIALKNNQTLMGLSEGEHKPTITNTHSDRNGGNGIVLAEASKVMDVRIERTSASGVLGVDVSGVSLLGVEVEGANQSNRFTGVAANVVGPIPHGGITLIAAKTDRLIENRIMRCTVTQAAGHGLGSFALGVGRSRLSADHVRSTGGAAVPPLFDMGVVVLADGRLSEAHLDLSDATIHGRLSPQGRNIVVFASAGAKATARIERSTLGEAGQDGIVAVAAMAPATVSLKILDSTIEKAAQTNLEGTILNLPASDPARADKSVVSIDVEGTTIRDAGAVDGFRLEAQNIWLGPTVFTRGPFAKGHYRLSIRDSVIEKALRRGIGLGNEGSEFGISPDPGEYQVELRNNSISGNGSAEIAISAANARIDARRNFWGIPEGLADRRVQLLEKTKRSQLDTSHPLTRDEVRMQDKPR